MSPPTDRKQILVSPPALNLRYATIADAAAIWQLVDRCPELDTNSCYTYLLLCSDFAQTCVVAEATGSLAGFVTGYVPPNRKDVLFVWQIGVAPQVRGHGIGRRLLRRLLETEPGQRARYLEATVTPGNEASGRLFQHLASELGCPLKRSLHFASERFAGGQHDDELLIRIGPIKPHKE